MAKEDQIIEALGVIKSNIRHIRRRSMRLGRYVNDVLETTVNATLPANYVWVFDPQGDKRVSSPAKNLSTEYGVGMAVIVAYNVDTQEDDVLGVDTILAPIEQGGAAAGLNSPQKPASLSTPVSARDITVGGVFAASSGGLDVRIGAFWHEGGYYPDSAALTLTPTATSSRKSFAVVGVNRLTNTASYTLTTDRAVSATLISNGAPTTQAVTDIMAVVDANPHIDWRGAVELKNGDTEVNPAKIVPLPWLKAVMVGADGVDAGLSGLVPTPAATDDVKFLKGDGTWDTPSSGALDVTDGVTTVTGATAIEFTSGATVTDNAGVAEVAITGGGGITHTYVGYNTAGGSNTSMVGGTAYMKKITLASAGWLGAIGVYIDHSATTNVQSLAAWVLSDNAGTPDLVIAIGANWNSQSFYINTTARWVDIAIGKLLTAGDYWLVVQRPVDSGTDLRIYYDGSGSDKTQAIGGGWNTDGNLYSISSTSNQYSIRGSILT